MSGQASAIGSRRIRRTHIARCIVDAKTPHHGDDANQNVPPRRGGEMTSSKATRSTVRLGAVIGAGVLLASTLTGCMGGNTYSGRSADRYRYESTTWQPKTVTLTDTRTGETAWSVDIPVGQALQVSFSEGTGPNEYRPDEIRWEMAPIGRTIITPMNRQPCPPASARRLDMTLRATPENVGSNPDPRWNEKSAYEN